MNKHVLCVAILALSGCVHRPTETPTQQSLLSQLSHDLNNTTVEVTGNEFDVRIVWMSVQEALLVSEPPSIYLEDNKIAAFIHPVGNSEVWGPDLHRIVLNTSSIIGEYLESKGIQENHLYVGDDWINKQNQRMDFTW